MKKIQIFFLLIFLITPFSAIAAPQAGTDEFLREKLNLPIESSDEPINPEDRENFDLAKGEALVIDPSGDVLTRLGTPSSINEAWGDIKRVEMTRNKKAKTWDLIVQLGGEIPIKPSVSAKLAVMVDLDGRQDNNDEDGTRGQADAEFSLIYNSEANQWQTRYRWYNPQSDFWAIDKSTTMTRSTEGDEFILRIPFSEIPSEKPLWRVILALADNNETQVDVAPTIGFPPPLGKNDLRGEPIIKNRPEIPLFKTILIFLGLVGITSGCIWIIITRKKSRLLTLDN